MRKIVFLFLLVPTLFFAQEIALLKYNGGGDWYANPTSLPNLIKFSNQTIITKIKAQPVTVTPDSPDFFNFFSNVFIHSIIVVNV